VLYAFEQGTCATSCAYHLTEISEDDLTDSLVRVHLFARCSAPASASQPQHTIHRRDARRGARGDRAPAQLARRLEMLRRVDLFAPLQEEMADIRRAPQLRAFARATSSPSRQHAHWVYLIAFARRGTLRTAAGADAAARHLHAGQFFGEMR